MKTIFITFPFGITARNIICARVVERIKKRGFRVVIISPKASHDFLRKIYTGENVAFEDFPLYEKMKKTIFDTMSWPEKILVGFINSALNTGATRYRRSELIFKKRYFRFLLRYFFQSIFKDKYNWSEKFRKIDAKFFPDDVYGYLFDKHNPVAVFTPHVQFDTKILKQARQRKIPSFGMPISIDTQTTKGMIRTKSDYLLVWNDIMKAEAIKYNSYKPENVLVVGVPQYDACHDKSLLMSREEFCRKLNVDPGKDIILYASEATDSLDDAETVQYLVNAMREGKIRKSVNIQVRPHPRDWRKATFESLKGLPGVVVDDPRMNTEVFLDRWFPSKESISWLLNSLYHSSMVIMMGSSIGMDAVGFDKPVISLGFDMRPKPYHKSVRRYFDHFQHQKYWFDTGAYRLTKNPEHLVEEINRYLVHPEYEAKERQDLINKLFYKHDGHVGTRIVKNIVCRV